MKRIQHHTIACFLGLIAIIGVALSAYIALHSQSTTATNNEQFEPLTISTDSLNGNSIWGASESWQTVVAAGGLDDYAAFFHEDRNSDYQGLPSTGSLTANSVPYSLSWTGSGVYDGNDTIRLYSSHPSTTVDLETIGAYQQIYVLATAGGPGEGHYANFSVTLNYTDGTSDVTSYRVYDWYDSTSVDQVYKLSGIKRRVISGQQGYEEANSDKPYLQSATIAVDSDKLLESIDLTLTGKDGSSNTSGIFCGVYAITGMVDNSVPSTPVALPATEVTTDSFVANWEMTTDATSYRLDVATDPNFTDILGNYNNLPVSTTSQLVEGLDDETTYYYRVRAVNDNGQSLSSNVITTTTLYRDVTPPVITAIGDNSTVKITDTLTISASDNVKVSTLEISSDSGVTWETLDPTTTNNITISENGTYTIRATDNSGNVSTTEVIYNNLDHTKPVVEVNTHGYIEGTWTNQPVTLTVSSSSTNLGTTTYEYSLDGETWLPYTDAILVTSETPADGTTYYFKATSAAGIESDVVSVVIKKDNTPPTGTITSNENSWSTFLNNITFGLFFNETQNFRIDAADDKSDIASIKYLVSTETFTTAEEALAQSGWTSVENGGSVPVDPELDFVIYYQITDGAGNTTVVNSDGIVLDTTPALIQGYALGTTYDLEDGHTYYLTQKLLITDNKKLGSIAIDGQIIEIPADGIITISGNQVADHQIVATDKAGNVTTLTIHTGAISDLMLDKPLDYANSDDLDDMDEVENELLSVIYNEGDNATDVEKEIINDYLEDLAETTEIIKQILEEIEQVETDYAALPDLEHITSDYNAAVDELIDIITNIIDEDKDHLTTPERERLQEILDSLHHLSDRIDEVDIEIDEIFDDAGSITPDNVKTGDEETIRDTIAKIDELLSTDNLTDLDREDLEDLRDRLEDALDKIADLKQTIEDAIVADPTSGTNPTVTPANVTRDDRQPLEDAATTYTQVLGEYADNLTPTETAALQDRITDINSSLDLLDALTYVENLFGKLPAATDVSLENQSLIEKARVAYESLSDYAKGLLDPALVSKYNAVLSAFYLYLNSLPPSFAIETRDIIWWALLILLLIGLIVYIIYRVRRQRLEQATATRHTDASRQHAKQDHNASTRRHKQVKQK